jgi:hypothetical protein
VIFSQKPLLLARETGNFQNHQILITFGFVTCRVKGPCLHRPENWLVRQLNDESKPVNIKWDLLERKERLQLGNCSGARKLVARCTGEG